MRKTRAILRSRSTQTLGVTRVPSVIEGSCLCGKVRFKIEGKPVLMGYCHCSRCRKAAGSAFLANIVFHRSDFFWVAGEELVSTYEANVPHSLKRSFCSNCGAYLGEPYCDGEHVVLAASTLDTDPGVRPTFHEYAEHKAPWFEITDNLKQYANDPDFISKGDET